MKKQQPVSGFASLARRQSAQEVVGKTNVTLLMQSGRLGAQLGKYHCKTKWDRGLCFRSTEETTFPGFDKPVPKGQSYALARLLRPTPARLQQDIKS